MTEPWDENLDSRSTAVVDSVKDKTISAIKLDDAVLSLCFTDGTQVSFLDDGQTCCEKRYLSTDDDLNSLVGHKFVHAIVKPGSVEYDDDENMIQTAFLEIQTTGGLCTITAYNEHNGYYGGFNIIARRCDSESEDQ